MQAIGNMDGINEAKPKAMESVEPVQVQAEKVRSLRDIENHVSVPRGEVEERPDLRTSIVTGGVSPVIHDLRFVWCPEKGSGPTTDDLAFWRFAVTERNHDRPLHEVDAGDPEGVDTSAKDDGGGIAKGRRAEAEVSRSEDDGRDPWVVKKRFLGVCVIKGVDWGRTMDVPKAR